MNLEAVRALGPRPPRVLGRRPSLSAYERRADLWRSLRRRMRADDAAPLVEALLTIIEASRAYQPGEIDKDAFTTKVLEATDNQRIIAALAA